MIPEEGTNYSLLEQNVMSSFDFLILISALKFVVTTVFASISPNSVLAVLAEYIIDNRDVTTWVNQESFR